jgi:hypothetical protein
VIVVDAVDVIEVEDQRPTAPLGDAANHTVILDPKLEETLDDARAADRCSVRDEDLVVRDSVRSNYLEYR